MKLIPISTEEFAGFCQKHPDEASVFNSLDWMQLFGNRLECYGLTNPQDKLLGGFYLYKDKIKGFTFYRSPPFCPGNGFVFVNQAENAAKRMGNIKSAMKLVADKLNDLAIKSIVTVSFPRDVKDTQPFYWKGFKVVPHYTYLHDLTKTEEEVFDCLSTETRNRIRKAGQEGIDVFEEHNPEKAQKLIQQTLSRKNAEVEGEWPRKILNDFASEDNSFMIFTEKDGKAISVCVCIFDNHTAYYLLGGIDQSVDNTGAGSLGLWNAIKKAKEMNLQKFDFEGSMLPGVESFFRSFGGELTPYYTINKASFWKEVLLKRSRRSSF